MSDFNKDQEEDKFVHEEAEMEDEELQAVHSQLMREKAEPTESMKPMPVVLMFIFGLLLGWGGYYIGEYNGDFRPDVFDPNWVPGGGGGEEIEFDPIARGKKLFQKQCQQCHQVDGMGLPGTYPPLVASDWLLNSETRPIKILIKGLSGSVTVLGKTYNGNMPPVGHWRDRDIAAVLTHVRSTWGNSATEITEEMVTKVREEISERTKPWKGPELLAEDPL